MTRRDTRPDTWARVDRRADIDGTQPKLDLESGLRDSKPDDVLEARHPSVCVVGVEGRDVRVTGSGEIVKLKRLSRHGVSF
jgi:hypothetical protein